MPQLAAETFPGTTGAAWPSQWTNVVGTATIQSNAGLLTPSTGGYAAARENLSAMASTGDTDVFGTIVMGVAGVEQYVTIGLNSDTALNTTNNDTPNDGYSMTLGYAATASSSTLLLFSTTSGTRTQVASLTKTLTGTTVYSFRLQRVGSVLRGRVWTGTEPLTWDVTYTIPGTPKSGIVTLSGSNGFATTVRTAKFGNITVTDATNLIRRRSVSSVATSGSGASSLSVTWPTNAIGDVALLIVTTTTTVTTPSGWTLLASDTVNTSAHLYVFWQGLTAVKSGSQALSFTTGVHKAAIAIYTGPNASTPPTSGFAITHNSSASTAVATTALAFANNYAIMAVAPAPAPTISAETTGSDVGWVPVEAADSATASTPSLMLIDGQIAKNGASTLTGTLSAAVLWAAFAWSPAPAVTVSSTGDVKVWNGSTRVVKPAKVWNGSAWVQKPVKVWNGSAWAKTTY